jgi:hypothetical protein
MVEIAILRPPKIAFHDLKLRLSKHVKSGEEAELREGAVDYHAKG